MTIRIRGAFCVAAVCLTACGAPSVGTIAGKVGPPLKADMGNAISFFHAEFRKGFAQGRDGSAIQSGIPENIHKFLGLNLGHVGRF